MTPTRRDFLTALPLACGSAALLRAEAPADDDLILRFSGPAKEWSEALPIGNGRLGGMVFADPMNERISFNEDTLWSGRPRDCNNPDAKQFLPEVRRLVLQEEKYGEAGKLCQKMQGPFNESYQPMGDLRLTGPAIRFDQMQRELDLDTAIATVRYSGYQREAFVSAVDQVLVLRVSAQPGGSIGFPISLESLLHSEARVVGNDELQLTGKAPAHVVPNYHGSETPVVYDDAEGVGMRFAACVKVIAEGGSVAASGKSLLVSDAEAFTVLLTTATGYRDFDLPPDLPAAAILKAAHDRLDAASRRTYAQLRADHVADHQKLFRRVSLRLGVAAPDLRPTPERLLSTGEHADPRLLALYFQYGRYLLIASSRPGTQPANLQGIWNDQVRPPWSSNWTANINVQMNYWPAETCNLAECHEPLFDLIEGVSRNGHRTASINYGVDGWVSHHNIDLWRQSAPVGEGTGSPTWANFCMSGAWLCAHLWEHYRFTGNRAFLRLRAYPILRGAAQFCLAWLVEDGHGRLTTCPSVSTENDFLTPDGHKAEVSAGCTLDMALIRELFANCGEAASILDLDPDLRARMKKASARLVPYQIGRYGQLQEWSKDFAEATPGQRHMSHLYPLYPGEAITPRATPELAKAARVSLERRIANGGAYTGWSRAWAIAFWARLLDGNMAEQSLTMLFKHSTGPNLFDTHPAPKGSIFQIDGNFGATASIAEMLMQSHGGEIAFLPALPATWADGSFRGLRARGGIEADLAWSGGKARDAVLRASLDGSIRVRAPQGQRIAAPRASGETVSLKVRSGGTYRIRFA